MLPLESTPGFTPRIDSKRSDIHPLKVITRQPYSVTLEDTTREGQLYTTVSGDQWVVVPPMKDSLIPHQPAPFYLNGASEAFESRQEHIQRAARGLPLVARHDEHSQLHNLQETFVITNWGELVGVLSETDQPVDAPVKAFREVGVDDYYVKVDRLKIQNNPNPPNGAPPIEAESIENCGRIDVLGVTHNGQIVLIDFTTPNRSKSQQLARQSAAVGAIISEVNTTDPELPAEVPPIHRFKGKYQPGDGNLYVLEFEEPGKKYTYNLATTEEITLQKQKNKERRNNGRNNKNIS